MTQNSLEDRTRGRRIAIGHVRRHHLYHAAEAYIEADRFGAWLTHLYIARPGLVRAMANILPASMALKATRLAGYNHPRLTPYTEVLATSAKAHLMMALLGSDVKRTGEAFGPWVARRCIEEGWGLHMGGGAALDAFELMRKHDSESPLILEQLTGDRGEGRRILLEEGEALGLADAEAEIDANGMSQRMVDRNAAEYEPADTIIAIAPFVRDSMIKAGVPADKIIVAELGVDLGTFPIGKTSRAPGEPLKIAFVGSNMMRKGLIYLLRAASRFDAAEVEVHIFGGKAPDAPFLQEHASRFIYHGGLSQKDLARALTECHVGALPSLWEGFGMAVYEMMACGLPVIISEHVPAPISEGVEGFTTRIRDEEAIAEAIGALLDEPTRARMGAAASDRARNSGWEHYRRAIRSGLGIATDEDRAAGS